MICFGGFEGAVLEILMAFFKTIVLSREKRSIEQKDEGKAKGFHWGRDCS
jgi:hypothetical protein